MTEIYAIGKLFFKTPSLLSVFPNIPEHGVKFQSLGNRDLLLFISHPVVQYQIHLTCSR